MLRLNPVLPLGLLALGWLVASELAVLVRGRGIRSLSFGARGNWILFWAILAWGIARNVFPGLSAA